MSIHGESESVVYIGENEIVYQIDVGLIVVSPHHRRRNRGDMEGLTQSIREHGVLAPLIGRRLEDGYELVAGARRLRALQSAGLRTAPMVLRPYSDAEALEVQVQENLQRADVHPMDEAELFELLRDHLKYTHERIAARHGVTKAHVRERLQLCQLCKPVRKMYLEGQLNHAMAFAIARLPDAGVQRKAAAELIETAGKLARFAVTEDMTRLETVTLELRERYMLALAAAPFSLADETLKPGPCNGCAHRSDAQMEMFAEIENPGSGWCLRPPCFEGKCKQTWKRAKAAAASDGIEVMEKSMFEMDLTRDNRLSRLTPAADRDYVLADGKDYWTRKRWSHLMGKGAKPVLAKGTRGEPVKLYPRKAAEAASRKMQKAKDAKKRAKAKAKPVSEADLRIQENKKRWQELRDRLDQVLEAMLEAAGERAAV